MKRETFEIKYSDRTATKHKWNSAIRETERLIKQLANDERTTYHLVGSESNKDKDGHYYEHGYRTWQGDNGNAVTFTIHKI
jgi:hypothetical protein